MVENLAGNSDFYKADNSNSHKEALDAALLQYKKGDYQQALKLYLDLSNYYTSPSLYLELGNCYFKLGQNNYALEYWKKTLELDPENNTAYSNIGNLYYKTKNVNHAIESWLWALTIEPEDPKVNLNLAVAYSDKDMRFESIKYYEKYLKYEKKQGDEYNIIDSKLSNYKDLANEYLKEGASFQSAGNNKAALDCYIKALSHYPNFSKTNFNIGSLFFIDNNYKQAIKYWLNSFFIDSAYPKTMLNLAISYDCLQEFDYAYCFYLRYSDYILDNKEEYSKVSKRLYQIKRYLKSNPHLIEKHLEKAKAFYENNDFYNAQVAYRNYILLKPEEKQIYTPILHKLALFINPESKLIEALSKEASKYSSQNDYIHALECYTRALNLCDPSSVEFSHIKAKHILCMRKVG